MRIQKCISLPLVAVVFLILNSCNEPPKEELPGGQLDEPNPRRVLVSMKAESQSDLSRKQADFYPFIREAYGIQDPSKLIFQEGSLRIETSDLNVDAEWKFYLSGLVQNKVFGHLQYFKLELFESEGKLYLIDRPNNILQMKYCWDKTTEEDCGYSDAFKKGPGEEEVVKYNCNCTQNVSSGTEIRGAKLDTDTSQQ